MKQWRLRVLTSENMTVFSHSASRSVSTNAADIKSCFSLPRCSCWQLADTELLLWRRSVSRRQWSTLFRRLTCVSNGLDVGARRRSSFKINKLEIKGYRFPNMAKITPGVYPSDSTVRPAAVAQLKLTQSQLIRTGRNAPAQWLLLPAVLPSRDQLPENTMQVLSPVRLN